MPNAKCQMPNAKPPDGLPRLSLAFRVVFGICYSAFVICHLAFGID
jgi:hypothetical protein